MFTKEAQNVAESFPSFVKLLIATRNPMLADPQANTAPERWETVTKAIWFVVPFHFLTFLGQGGDGALDVSTLVLVGIGSLLALMWIGTLIGVVPVRMNMEYEVRAKHWVTALVSTWFFSVLAASFVALVIWLTASEASGWPNLPNWILEQLLGGTGPDRLVLSLLAATAGVIGLISVSSLKSNSQAQFFSVPTIVFIVVNWLVCAALMYISSMLLAL